jgi:hypothetical protein
MSIKPASRETESGTAPLDRDGSGLGWKSAAEMTHEHRIRDLAKATQARLAPSLA